MYTRSQRTSFGLYRKRGLVHAPKRLWVAASITALATSLPLFYLALRSVEMGSAALELIWRPRTLGVLLNSISLTIAVTISSVCIGVSIAWLTVRTTLPGRRLWEVLSTLPLVIPSYVMAYVLIGALGPKGLLQAVLEPLGIERLPSLYGFKGAWLTLTLVTFPYVMLSVRSGLKSMDASLEDASRMLGSSAFRVFWDVTFPHIKPSIHAGALLVALYTLSDFGAVSLLQFNSFTREIYMQYTATFDRSVAAILALMLVLLTLVILGVEFKMRGKATLFRTSLGVSRSIPRRSLHAWGPASILLLIIITTLSVFLPVLVISYWWIHGFLAGEPEFTGFGILFNSVSVSLLTAVISIIAAVPVVFLAVRLPSRLTRLMERCAYMGHALPGIVVALSLVFFGIRLVPFLYQSIWMLIFAYIVLFLPQAIGPIRASILNISPRIEDAARSLGYAPKEVLHTITLPLLKPGLIAGFALIFLTCMKELPATLLLGPIGFNTLATKIWSTTEEAFFAKAAAPAILLICVSAISIGFIFAQERNLTFGSGANILKEHE